MPPDKILSRPQAPKKGAGSADGKIDGFLLSSSFPSEASIEEMWKARVNLKD